MGLHFTTFRGDLSGIFIRRTNLPLSYSKQRTDQRLAVSFTLLLIGFKVSTIRAVFFGSLVHRFPMSRVFRFYD